MLPERGGSLELLKKYINLQNDKDWLLMQACNASSAYPGNTARLKYLLWGQGKCENNGAASKPEAD